VLFFLTDLLVLGLITSIMVTGLNLQYGYAGVLNFAYYQYVAIGAYIAGVTTMGRSTTPEVTYILGWTLPWYLGLLLAGVVTSAVGAIVFAFTVRRLRSDYLGIVTVASAFIIWNIINDNLTLFDGATGLFNVPYITGSLNVSTEEYSLILAGVAFVILAVFFVISRLIFRSPLGRLLRAIREDDEIPPAFGRSIWQPQLFVFMVGNFMAGVAGGLLIFYITAWSPYAFLPIETFGLMGALIIGGSGSYWGPVIGAFVVLEGLVELSRYVPTFGHAEWAGAFRLVLVGVLIIVILRYRPEGLIPERWLRWYPRSLSDERPLSADEVIPLTTRVGG
jgi:ABC-type branched-subunit amino acid transport system permease subunit